MKGITAFLFILMVLLLISGCLDSESSEVLIDDIEKREIVMYIPADGSGVIKKLVKDYEMDNEDIAIQINSDFVNTEAYYEELVTTMASGEQIPHVIILKDVWINEFASKDWIYPLNGLTSNKYFAGIEEAGIIDGKKYAVPIWHDVPLLYYRSDIVENPPVTWDQLYSIAINHKGQNEIQYGYIFPGNGGDNLALSGIEWLWAYDVSIDFNEDAVDGNVEGIERALMAMGRFVENDVIPRETLDFNPEDARKSFEMGHAIFMRNWSYAWKLYNMDSSPIKGKVGIAPMPVRYEEQEQKSILSGWLIAMTNNDGIEDDIRSFISFLGSERTQEYMGLETGLPPTIKTLFEDFRFINGIGMPPVMKDVLNTSISPSLGVDSMNKMAYIHTAFYDVISDGYGNNKKAVELANNLSEALEDETDGDDSEDDEGE